MGRTHKSAGTATITEVARHWSIDRETAMRILEENDVTFICNEGPLRVAWADVWSIEGSGYVSSANYDAFKEPLLRVERLGTAPEKCHQPDIYMNCVKLKPSALRARIFKIHSPIVRLSKRIQRVRSCDLDALLEQIGKSRKK